jgi:RNA polymerase sigma factor (TIGR02999 family)
MRKGARKTVMAIRDSSGAHYINSSDSAMPTGPTTSSNSTSAAPASGLDPTVAVDSKSALQQRKALDELFSVTYEELRRLASTVSRGDPSATMNPTALVNEAWIKLSKSPNLAATSRMHFKRIAARAMRQLLVEAARRRKSQKRGAGELTVSFDDSFDEKPSSGKELLVLDAALDELAKIEPRQALMVESRFFGGLDIAETAAMLEVSEATILRDWRAAKAWLARELHRER